jgi:hypothetical protein
LWQRDSRIDYGSVMDSDETAETTTTTNKRVVDVLIFTLQEKMTYLGEQKELDDDQHRCWQLVTR